MPPKPREIWENGTPIGERLKHAVQDCDVLEALVGDALLAYGFPVRPRRSRTPRLIDRVFWMYAKVDEDNDIAKDTMAEFHRVRVIDPGQYPEIEFRPKIGRSTQRDLILRHCFELSRQYPEFFYASNKDKIAAIRKSIQKEDSDIDVYGEGFGDSAMEKHIRDLKREFEKFLDSL